MTIIKKISVSLITLVAVLGLTACSEDKAETVGEKTDKMVHDAGDAVEDAGDKIGNMADDAGDKIGDMADDAGDKFGDMKKDAGNAIEDACEKVKEGVNAEDKDC